MSKKSRSLSHIVTDVFYWNTHLGGFLLFLFIASITFWLRWADQKTGCTVVLSIYNQYKNSITRELALDNPVVAQANFTAFARNLNSLRISNSLKLELLDTNTELDALPTCSFHFLSSKLNIPLQYNIKTAGSIVGSISYFPSLFAIIFIWLVAVFLVLTLQRIERGIQLKLQKYLIDPITLLSIGNELAHSSEYPGEVKNINHNFKTLKQKIISSEKMENEMLRVQQVNLLASQVSHDIRSPLSALNLMVNQLPQVAEDKRIIIRSAINRINDIANQLLHNEKQNPTSLNSTNNESSIHLLSPILDSIVSEKRIQYREIQSVEIDADILDGYGLFASINSMEVKRAISNLVNNAVESLPNQVGKINVGLKNCVDQVKIIVQDTGKGIPKSLLKRVGEIGFTHGKIGARSGSGLGLYHAAKIMKEAGGELLVDSEEGKGTAITMAFKKSTPPKWFVQKLLLTKNMQIVSLDDDISTHQIWKGRFESIRTSTFGITHRTFTSASDFKNWFRSGPAQDLITTSKFLFLVDYELLNQNTSGLEVIRDLKIGDQSILVTSRYEEPHIREVCKKLGVRLIPKTMTGFVPIEIEQPKDLLNGVLIDDDPLVHSFWNLYAKENNKELVGFTNSTDFFHQVSRFNFETNIFVDSNLGNNVKGEDVTKQISELGFKNVYLCTGYSASHFPSMPWIKAIIGKEPYTL